MRERVRAYFCLLLLTESSINGAIVAHDMFVLILFWAASIVPVALLILGYELGEFRFVGELALWVVMIFALASGVDYFIKFSRCVLKPHKS